MTQPKVSILVPVYGVEKFIERCAVSLMEQTYENIEYIFVDDATKDNSIFILETVVQRYPNRLKQVKILHHAENRGLSFARNTAIAAVTGLYMLHVDSDDYLTTDAIEKLSKEAEKENADIVLFDTYELRENETAMLRVEYKDRISYIKGLLQHTFRCAHWNKFYRTDFYKKTKINCVEYIRLAEDYAVTPRLVHQAKNITVLHEALYYYETCNQNSYVHKLSRDSVVSLKKAENILFDYFTSVPDSQLWFEVVEILSQRSISSLLKHYDKDTWSIIEDEYGQELNRSGKGLKLVDRIIYELFRAKCTTLLTLFLSFYRYIYSKIGQ